MAPAAASASRVLLPVSTPATTDTPAPGPRRCRWACRLPPRQQPARPGSGPRGGSCPAEACRGQRQRGRARGPAGLPVEPREQRIARRGGEAAGQAHLDAVLAQRRERFESAGERRHPVCGGQIGVGALERPVRALSRLLLARLRRKTSILAWPIVSWTIAMAASNARLPGTIPTAPATHGTPDRDRLSSGREIGEHPSTCGADWPAEVLHPAHFALWTMPSRRPWRRSWPRCASTCCATPP